MLKKAPTVGVQNVQKAPESEKISDILKDTIAGWGAKISTLLIFPNQRVEKERDIKSQLEFLRASNSKKLEAAFDELPEFFKKAHKNTIPDQVQQFNDQILDYFEEEGDFNKALKRAVNDFFVKVSENLGGVEKGSKFYSGSLRGTEITQEEVLKALEKQLAPRAQNAESVMRSLKKNKKFLLQSFGEVMLHSSAMQDSFGDVLELLDEMNGYDAMRIDVREGSGVSRTEIKNGKIDKKIPTSLIIKLFTLAIIFGIALPYDIEFFARLWETGIDPAYNTYPPYLTVIDNLTSFNYSPETVAVPIAILLAMFFVQKMPIDAMIKRLSENKSGFRSVLEAFIPTDFSKKSLKTLGRTVVVAGCVFATSQMMGLGFMSGNDAVETHNAHNQILAHNTSLTKLTKDNQELREYYESLSKAELFYEAQALFLKLLPLDGKLQVQSESLELAQLTDSSVSKALVKQIELPEEFVSEFFQADPKDGTKLMFKAKSVSELKANPKWEDLSIEMTSRLLGAYIESQDGFLEVENIIPALKEKIKRDTFGTFIQIFEDAMKKEAGGDAGFGIAAYGPGGHEIVQLFRKYLGVEVGQGKSYDIFLETLIDELYVFDPKRGEAFLNDVIKPAIDANTSKGFEKQLADPKFAKNLEGEDIDTITEITLLFDEALNELVERIAPELDTLRAAVKERDHKAIGYSQREGRANDYHDYTVVMKGFSKTLKELLSEENGVAGKLENIRQNLLDDLTEKDKKGAAKYKEVMGEDRGEFEMVDVSIKPPKVEINLPDIEPKTYSIIKLLLKAHYALDAAKNGELLTFAEKYQTGVLNRAVFVELGSFMIYMTIFATLARRNPRLRKLLDEREELMNDIREDCENGEQGKVVREGFLTRIENLKKKHAEILEEFVRANPKAAELVVSGGKEFSKISENFVLRDTYDGIKFLPRRDTTLEEDAAYDELCYPLEKGKRLFHTNPFTADFKQFQQGDGQQFKSGDVLFVNEIPRGNGEGVVVEKRKILIDGRDREALFVHHLSEHEDETKYMGNADSQFIVVRFKTKTQSEAGKENQTRNVFYYNVAPDVSLGFDSFVVTGDGLIATKMTESSNEEVSLNFEKAFSFSETIEEIDINKEVNQGGIGQFINLMNKVLLVVTRNNKQTK